MVLRASEAVCALSAAADAAAIRAVVQPRLERVVEAACRPEGPVAFDRFLERRNREPDGVEFSAWLRRTGEIELWGVGAGKGRRGEVVEGAAAERRQDSRPGGAGHPGAGHPGHPRIGEVLPVAAEQIRRRVEVVYRVQVPLNPGARVDVVG